MRKTVRYIFLALLIVSIQLGIILIASSQFQQRAECKISTAVSEVQNVAEEEAEHISPFEIYWYREQQQLPQLDYDEGLFMSASQRARDIYYGRSKWNHDGYGEVIKTNYGWYQLAGENLARDFKTESEVFEAWKKSPTHNAVMLNKKACEYGFAKFGTVYVLHVGCKK